jgi:hypothetical protein
MRTRLATLLCVAAMLAMALGPAVVMAAPPPPSIVYDATPSVLPGNMASLGFQATQTSEFGDYVHLAGTNRAVRTVTVTMSDWALYADYSSDGRYSGNSATWSHPITLNIYNVVPGTPNTLGARIATTTQDVTIPWRPVADPTCTTSTAWRAPSGTCYNGMAFNITFDLSSLNVLLPNDIVVGVAYNTQSYGLSPMGVNGPYNSLNVGVVGLATVGTDEHIDKVFYNTSTAAWYADLGTGGTGTFREDTEWAPNGTMPMQITAAAGGLNISTDKTVFCGAGENATVKIELSNIANLYGYQFQLGYDDSLVYATGAWVDFPFTTADPAARPWDATCAGGVCRFSVSHVEPQAAVSGSGTVAQVVLTPRAAGIFTVTVSGDILSDRNANVIAHTAAAPLPLTVCGVASASGTVSLQGRATPIDLGKVTLTNGVFGPYDTNFDTVTGAWSISNIKVLPGGTSYTIDATHGLYLGNQMVRVLNPGEAYAAPATRLKGGDVNTSGDSAGKIDGLDLGDVGRSFGQPPAGGAGTGSDINADGIVNILDLVLVGGNFGLAAPQPWNTL